MGDLTVKTIVDKEQCQDITRTVCTVSGEVVENNICVYSYEKQSESTVATTVKVTYAKECSKQYVTVCQPGRGYGGYVSLALPKQVCTELVYGHAKAITAQQYHAKVLYQGTRDQLQARVLSMSYLL